MYVNAIKYKDIWLAPGSQAFVLYHDKDPKKRQELDKLIKSVDEKDRALTKNNTRGVENGATSGAT